MQGLKERLTFANVTSVAALFIALGGTSYAAVTLPRNSVGSNQIRTSAVRSAEVKDRSLSVRDLTRGTRTALKGARGERGPAGPTGPTGGSSGPGGTSVTITTETASGSVTRQQLSSEVTASCGPNRKVTGGAVRIDSAGDNEIRRSIPNAAGTGWVGQVENGDDPPPVGQPGPFNFTVIAICAG